HSLLATRLVSRVRAVLGVEPTLQMVFEAPTPARLAVRLDTAETARPALTRRPRPPQIPVSFAQQRLWFLDRLDGPNATYNMPIVVGLSGVVEMAVLQAALADVITRHESLRTVIEVVDGQPVQTILPEAAPQWTVTDIDREDLEQAVAEAAGYVFDLATEIPIRAWLWHTGSDEGPAEYVLAVVMHHIAADGWSMAPLARDLSQAYTARLQGRAPQFGELPVQYADYTLWQQELLGGEDDPDSLIHRQLDYWRRQLQDVPAELALPTDRPRPAVATHRGAWAPFTVSAATYQRLVRTARDHGTTVFMLLHAVLAVLLNRIGAGDDIPVGAAMAGRGDEALDDLVGFFVNTVVLRTDLSGDPSFAQLLTRVRDIHLGAHAHADVPFERVVDAVGAERSVARQALFQVMLVLQNNARAGLDLPETTLTDTGMVHAQVAKFDLVFSLTETTDATETTGAPAGLVGGIEYATDLFDHTTITALADRFVRVLETV
ncbi:non-ribosomal peptide synthetase, partial [Nocardia terpenica]|uniref:condensation domain-containing protein n=1 Tax=Nocardia terpenica TaxID=455432 RepID=UPI002FE30D1E